MVEVIPITQSAVDWDKYLSVCDQVLGRKVSHTFDKAGLKKGLPAYLLSIQDFKQTNRALKHLHFSFMMVMLEDTFLEWVDETDLTITFTDTSRRGFVALLVSGTLDQWVKTIIDCSSDNVSSEVRTIGNKCQSCFEAFGLNSLFASFSKTRLHDQTFKLVFNG